MWSRPYVCCWVQTSVPTSWLLKLLTMLGYPFSCHTTGKTSCYTISVCGCLSFIMQAFFKFPRKNWTQWWKKLQFKQHSYEYKHHYNQVFLWSNCSFMQSEILSFLRESSYRNPSKKKFQFFRLTIDYTLKTIVYVITGTSLLTIKTKMVQNYFPCLILSAMLAKRSHPASEELWRVWNLTTSTRTRQRLFVRRCSVLTTKEKSVTSSPFLPMRSTSRVWTFSRLSRSINEREMLSRSRSNLPLKSRPRHKRLLLSKFTVSLCISKGGGRFLNWRKF